MGFFDRSSSNVSNQYDTYNLGIQDSDQAVVNVGGTVITTDGGLLEAIRGAFNDLLGQVGRGFDAGERSVDAGRDVLLETISSGERNLDVVADLTRDVVDVGRAQNELVASVLSDAAREQFRASADTTRDVLGFSERTIQDTSRAVLEGQRDAFDFAGDAGSRAIAAVGEAGDRQLAFGRDSLDFARDAIAAGDDAGARAFDFATSSQRDALDYAGVTTARALDVVDSNTGRVLDTAYELGRGFLDESGALVDRVLTQANNSGAAFLTAVENFQARESNNADARLQDITRTGLIGIFVVAGLGVLAYAWTHSKG